MHHADAYKQTASSWDLASTGVVGAGMGTAGATGVSIGENAAFSILVSDGAPRDSSYLLANMKRTASAAH